MKNFRFALESVLEARCAQESDARHQMAAAALKQREALNRSLEARSALQRLLEEIATASSGRFTAAERERAWTTRRAQERICADLRTAEQECARITAEKRAALLEARRNRELLERLKDSRRSAWQKEAGRVEQHQLDEFALTRRHQASNQAHALC